MVDVAVPSTARAILTVQQSNGDVGVNVLHFATATDALSLTAMTALKSYIQGKWVTDIAPLQTSNDRLVNIRIQDLTSVPYTTQDTAVSVFGTAGSNELPKQVAAVGTINTLHAGRSGRGRFYIGSLTTSCLAVGGGLSTTAQGFITTFGADLITGVVSGDATFKLGVYSRKNGLTYTANRVTCDGRADIQRRRANRRIF